MRRTERHYCDLPDAMEWLGSRGRHARLTCTVCGTEWVLWQGNLERWIRVITSGKAHLASRDGSIPSHYARTTRLEEVTCGRCLKMIAAWRRIGDAWWRENHWFDHRVTEEQRELLRAMPAVTADEEFTRNLAAMALIYAERLRRDHPST